MNGDEQLNNFGKQLDDIKEKVNRWIEDEKITVNCSKVFKQLLQIVEGVPCDIKVENLVEGGDKARSEYNKIKDDTPSSSKRIQAFLLIKRYLNIISFFIGENGVSKDMPADVLDYYLFDNRLMELRNIGLSFYSNVLFQYNRNKENFFVYRCDKGDTKGHNEEYWKKCKTREEVMKEIVERSQIHISKRIGTENIEKDWFKSYSACMGRNLHRYMDARGFNDEATYEIAEGKYVNTVAVNDEGAKSVQEFLWEEKTSKSENSINVSNNEVESDSSSEESNEEAPFKKVGFCLATYNVRDNSNDNFRNWSTEFLGRRVNWSESEKENSNSEETVNDGDRLLGAIPDYEIVTTKDYFTAVNNIPPVCRRVFRRMEGIRGKVIFKLNFSQRVGLLFGYYMLYMEKKGSLKRGEEKIDEMINALDGKQNGIDYFEDVSDSDIKKIREAENVCKKLKEAWKEYHLCCIYGSYCKNQDSDLATIWKILSYVNWDNELQYMENIYHKMLEIDTKNSHVNPNTMYGLDDKNGDGEYMAEIPPRSARGYRRVISYIKLSFLNIAVLGHKYNIDIQKKEDKKMYNRCYYTGFIYN